MQHHHNLQGVVEDILKNPLDYYQDTNCGLRYSLSFRGSLNSCASSSLVSLEEEDFESIFDAIETFSADTRLKDQYLIYHDALALGNLSYNCAFHFYDEIRGHLYDELKTTKRRSQLKTWFDKRIAPYEELSELICDCNFYVWNYKDMVYFSESLESHIELLEQGLRPVLG